MVKVAMKLEMDKSLKNQWGNWNQLGLELDKLLDAYNWQYRNKICSNCNPEQKKNRGCETSTLFENGIQETHCDHLTKARTNKLSKEIEAHLMGHPLYS